MLALGIKIGATADRACDFVFHLPETGYASQCERLHITLNDYRCISADVTALKWKAIDEFHFFIGDGLFEQL